MKTYGVTGWTTIKDISRLKEYEIPKPQATGHDLLVKIKAVATNPIDFKKLSNFGNVDGAFPDNQDPLTVGWDASGIVEQVGEDTSLFSVGDEVYFAGDWLRPGAFADYTLVDERIVGKKPSRLSHSQAASIPLTGLTAWEAMVDQLHISEDKAKNAGKKILIVGGGGGVSTAAVNIAKHAFGLTVIATGSRPESVQYVKELGADYVISHRKNLTEQINALGFKELDYVFHTADLTPELVTEFVGLLKPFGGISCTWPPCSVDLMVFIFKAISFSAELMFARPPLKNEDAVRQHDILTKMSELLEKGVLTHRAVNTMDFSLENLKKALQVQASGKAIGKITLECGS